MAWPKVEVTSNKVQTEYKFIGGSWLPMVMCYTMFAALFVPYFIVLAQRNLDPFLPFVSQVAGSPPQSGVFALLLVATGLLALLGLNFLNMGIRIQKKRVADQWVHHTVSLLNKITLIPGHVGILGMITVGSFPLDSHRSTESWMSVTIIPHLIGSMCVFIGGIFYCILITYIMSLLHPERKQLLGIRIFLLCLITMCSALQGYTVRDAFMGEFEEGNRLTTCTVDSSHVQYNMSYLVCSVCEWSLLLTFIVFFMTLREEAGDFCFTMSITLKDDQWPEVDGQKKETISNDKNQNIGTEERKRDSSEERS